MILPRKEKYASQHRLGARPGRASQPCPPSFRPLIPSSTGLAVLLGLLGLLGVAGCTTDCIYESYTNDEGQAACARVCPLEDADGNEVTDSNGKTVFESPQQGEDVNRINCDPFRSVTSVTASSGTTTSTSSTGTTSTTSSTTGG